MLTRHPKDRRILCNIHKTNAIQLGCCLSCSNKATICETKGCIGFHEENERAHNILTLQQIRHIVSQYVNSSVEKRAYLKKMVHEYFTVARKEIQRLFTEVYESIDHFVFDDFIFHEDEMKLIKKLKEEQYESLTCEEVALIVPKLIKSTDFEDGHFTHLRNYLIAEKSKVQSLLNMSLLNLPEFRWKSPEENVYLFTEFHEDELKDVNTRLINMVSRPKRLRINYSNLLLTQSMQGSPDKGLSKYRPIQSSEGQGQKMEFVRLIGTLETLKDLQAFELHCLWEVDENEFQIAVVEALLTLEYLKELTIYTAYKITSTEYLQELAERRPDLEIKVYLKRLND